MNAALGQVFTPAPVADLALSLALEGRPGARLLDPSCGDGVFLARAAARGLAADGVEIDPEVAANARAYGHVRVGDFFADEPAARYDVVVGNPPYVRQEALGPARKAAIAACLPGVALGGRADLALAFVAQALRWLAPGGRLAFVLSAAVLDAGRAALRAILEAGGARVRAVVASPRERWFPDAAVHAVILVVDRDGPPTKVALARLRVPVADANVTSIADLARVAEVRHAPHDPDEWGPLLRAPDAWLRARAEAGDWLVPLEELAEIRRGVTSGANEFFYLTRARATELRLEPGVLAPLLKTPRHAGTIGIDATTLPTLAFVCAEPPPNARAYVRAHEALAARPTLAARPRWWSLAARPARLFLTKAYSARFVQHLTSAPVVADQRVYALFPRPGVDEERLAAALNGTLTALALESLGRASMGEGALEWSVGDAARLPVLDARRVDARGPLRAMLRRRIGDAAAEAVAPDRRALDEALLPAPLASMRSQLAAALAATVEERLFRARLSRDTNVLHPATS